MKEKIISVFAILLIVILACSCKTETNDDSVKFYETDEEVFRIETAYCDLYYPEKWEDKIEINIEDGEQYIIHFTANMENKSVPLFDLIFGGNEGYKLGTLKLDNQEMSLYIIDYEFNQDDFDEQVYFNLCGMCDDVNVIISKLIEDGNFELAS